MVKRWAIIAFPIFFIFAFTSNLRAADENAQKTPQPAAEDKATEMSKKVEDPLSGLILMPLEYSYTGSVGPIDKSAQQLIIEPTFPIDITDKWKILTHTLIPIVSLPQLGDDRPSSGLSNIMFSALLAKKSESKLTWGIGGGVMFPTASNTDPVSWTNTPTGYDCWALGPSVVGVFKSGNWVTGALVNQMWRISGESNLNMMQIQAFAFYNLGQGYSISSMPLISVDWTKKSSQSTLIPLGLMVGKLFMIGGVFPLGLSLGTYYNIVKPDDAPQSTIRGELFFVLPEVW
ncbi:MAG TPA: hypothetical protein VIS94_02295 [Desulfomonilia bacterium]